MNRFAGLSVMMAASVAATPALAAPVIPINTIALFNGTGSAVSNNAITINDGTVKVQVTAWNTTSTNLASGTNRARGTLSQWDYGLGASYTNDGSHTVDNAGRYDFLLLQFDTKVALNTVTFTSGWDGYDSDATISRANLDYAALGIGYRSVGSTFWNAAGAQLQANKTDSMTPNNTFVAGAVNTSRRQVNPTLVTSNVWLVAAKIGSNDTYGDAFKLKGFTYVDPYNHGGAVPEPSTWAMLILGMGMVGGAMRRKVRTRLVFA